MSVTIPQDIIEQAKALNAAGGLPGAYQLLADAGDMNRPLFAGG